MTVPAPEIPPMEKRSRLFTVVCFGDSITGCRPGEPYRHQYLKWCDLLELMLEARLGPGAARVVNAGHAGDRTYPSAGCPGAASRLRPQVLDERPDLVLVLLGANDLAPPARPDGPDGLARDLEAIGRKILDSGARLCFLQYALPRAADPATAWSHHALANPPAAEAARRLGVPVVALEPAFAAAEAAGVPRDALADPVDGVHLRPEGERAAARAVFEGIVRAGLVPPGREEAAP